MTAERVALNDATFREANESIVRAAERIGIDGLVPFICECADATCTQLVRLSIAEYEQVRVNPAHFINVDGHEASANGWARVVAETDRYVTVEKVGRAKEIVEKLDPRSSGAGA